MPNIHTYTYYLKRMIYYLGVRGVFVWPCCGVDPLVLRSSDDVDEPSMTSPVRLGKRPPPKSTPGGIGRDPARHKEFIMFVRLSVKT